MLGLSQNPYRVGAEGGHPFSRPYLTWRKQNVLPQQTANYRQPIGEFSAGSGDLGNPCLPLKLRSVVIWSAF